MQMAVRVYWEDELQTIVRYDFEGKWTWEELYPVYDQAIAMETSAPHRVDIILDMRRSLGVPSNALSHLKNISDKQPANVGASIFVTESKFLLALYNVGCKFYYKIPHYFQVVPTIEAAHEMIAKLRMELKKVPSESR